MISTSVLRAPLRASDSSAVKYKGIFCSVLFFYSEVLDKWESKDLEYVLLGFFSFVMWLFSKTDGNSFSSGGIC